MPSPFSFFSSAGLKPRPFYFLPQSSYDLRHVLLHWRLSTRTVSQAGPAPTGHTRQPQNSLCTVSSPCHITDLSRSNAMWCLASLLIFKLLLCYPGFTFYIVHVYEMYYNKTSWVYYNIFQNPRKEVESHCATIKCCQLVCLVIPPLSTQQPYCIVLTSN